MQCLDNQSTLRTLACADHVPTTRMQAANCRWCSAHSVPCIRGPPPEPARPAVPCLSTSQTFTTVAPTVQVVATDGDEAPETWAAILQGLLCVARGLAAAAEDEQCEPGQLAAAFEGEDLELMWQACPDGRCRCGNLFVVQGCRA